MFSSLRFRARDTANTGALLYAWGNDGYTGTDFAQKTSPSEISGNWAALPKTSAYSSFGIRTDNFIYFLGYHVGFNSLPGGQVNTTALTASLSNPWSQVSAGANFILAIRGDGKLFSLGTNTYGQLGTNSTTDNFSTLALVSSSVWTMVSAGEYHSLAIRSDGALFSWGLNQFGALGNGTATTTNVLTPQRVGTDTWSYVDAGAYGTLAIRSDGKLFGWGAEVPGLANTDGIVTQIGADNWTAVSFSKNKSEFEGFPHALAIRSDNKLFAWGGGQYGKLGTGGTASQSAPIQIGTDNWSAISAGINFSLGINISGNLFAWGRNNYGQLGLGDTAQRTVPTQVGTKTWSEVVAILDAASLALEST